MALEKSKSLNKELAILSEVILDASLVVGTSSGARLLALQDFRYDSKCSDKELEV